MEAHAAPFKANVLTGLINLSLDTLAQLVFTSFAIVAVYMLIVASVAVFMDVRGIRLRFWSARSQDVEASRTAKKKR